MDINKLDKEIEIKIIESYKETLKCENTQIFIENEEKLDSEVIESYSLDHDDEFFSLTKERHITGAMAINDKYKKLIPKHLYNKTKNMSDIDTVNYIFKKTRYLSILKPFLGNRSGYEYTYEYNHKIYFDDIIISIDEDTYNKLRYYTLYVYRVQKLYSLNAILGFEQKFNIVFDENGSMKHMYDSINGINNML